MFTKSAEFYDALYSWKDYPAEAHQIKEIVARNAPQATTLLDVACGTGAHLQHLVDSFEACGVDLDQDLLSIARAKVPRATFYQGDMTSLDLGRHFGAVICMFSSIGYVGTKEGLGRAVASMAGHLDPEGVVIFEPWFFPETFEVGFKQKLDASLGNLTIERTSESSVRESQSVIDFEYVVRNTSDGSEERFSERHVMGLFGDREYRQALLDAGLELCEFDSTGPTGRGLYVATRP